MNRNINYVDLWEEDISIYEQVASGYDRYGNKLRHRRMSDDAYGYDRYGNSLAHKGGRDQRPVRSNKECFRFYARIFGYLVITKYLLCLFMWSRDPFESAIPELIVMTDRFGSLNTIMSRPRQINAWKTIETYQSAWEEGHWNLGIFSWLRRSTEVWYLNNRDCLVVINRVEERLVKYFKNETEGMFKADICRLAALYERGGYYFDTDMVVVKVVILNPRITFSVPRAVPQEHLKNMFFQSFIAVAPKHPIIKINMRILLEHYRSMEENGTRLLGPLLGPESLYTSYVEFNNNTEESKHWPMDLDLEEVPPETYPETTKGRGTQYECNYMVHNSTEKIVYFFSRLPGAGSLCPAI